MGVKRGTSEATRILHRGRDMGRLLWPDVCSRLLTSLVAEPIALVKGMSEHVTVFADFVAGIVVGVAANIAGRPHRSITGVVARIVEASDMAELIAVFAALSDRVADIAVFAGNVAVFLAGIIAAGDI